ncbi:hypothetical protein FN846DRAFT_788030 [Sphaerosporella brunnea]|uniref:Uncharacterized protein n=1 Tax=Sphaerosporella brunnea TaxID=1250544 RepID=A0A5J5EDM4_9PEZI|nr:hypothetical protein FN846DRAFT_788030 [Sphaerosporella brunnea]
MFDFDEPIAMRPVPELTRFTLPGFGLPLNFVPTAQFTITDFSDPNLSEVVYPARGEGGRLFVTALSDRYMRVGRASLRLKPLRELAMLKLMNRITDKPGWEKKVFDDTIADKWKREALATPGVDIVPSMADWCIDELRHHAAEFSRTGYSVALCGDVVKSDSAVPQQLREKLVAAAARLENVPPHKKDWHPGSDGMVLDLVHPSLFPLVYGRSRILPDRILGLDECLRHAGEGAVLPVPPETELEEDTELDEDTDSEDETYWPRSGRAPAVYSPKFQWLPCDVEFVGEKREAKIVSYINNLHPAHNKDLYGVIEKLIDCAIPLWNKTLNYQKFDIDERNRIPYREVVYEPIPADDPRTPQRMPGEEEGEFYDRLEEWKDSIRNIVKPEPVGTFQQWRNKNDAKRDWERVDLREDYAHRGLQVIVKLANIHLTTEKPKYEGGTWHVEGMTNEHICASALYYYDSENITESLLAFRARVAPPSADDIDYEQEHHEWLKEVFGCGNEEAAVQEIGDVVALPGRLVTFPNFLQHRVKPFQLADPTRPGHRKIVALFLVDPHLRVISTSNVPPQQHDWWAQEVAREQRLNGLPLAVRHEVAAFANEFPMGLEEAKSLREELMEERKVFVVEHGEVFEGETFSLCEH